MLPESNCEYRTHTYWEQRYAALLAADPVAVQGNVDAVDMATTATDKANVKPTLNSSSDDADLQHDNTTSTEIVFDWFKKYADLQQIFHALITDKHARILMLGCGNSTLSEDLYRDGYENIVNVDFSESVIRMMRERCREMAHMEWHVEDVQSLASFGNHSFDVAVDKGTMDALMCERGDVWEPSSQLIEDVRREVDQVVRVLRPGGVFIYITFGQPHFRRRHLERPGVWTLEVQKIGEAFHYFVYVMRKHDIAEEVEKAAR